MTECDNCGEEIEELNRDKCPECGQQYVFDPTKPVDGAGVEPEDTVETTEEETGSADDTGPDTDKQSSFDSSSKKDSEEKEEGDVLWSAK